MHGYWRSGLHFGRAGTRRGALYACEAEILSSHSMRSTPSMLRATIPWVAGYMGADQSTDANR